MAEQEWRCERCKSTSKVNYVKDEDVYAVRYRIADDHARISPKCAADWGLSSVTVTNHFMDRS